MNGNRKHDKHSQQISAMGKEDYSVNTGKIRTFGTADYVVFFIVLIICALICIFYAFKDRRENRTVVFLLGEKIMHVLPVALSLSVTFVSALSILGNPVEMYNFNTMFSWLLLSLLLAVAAASFIFIPFFYKLRVTTVFEYLNKRFSTPVRMICSAISIVQTIVYCAFLLYSPALVISFVTGISLWLSAVFVGLVVVLYTIMGGTKAVLWIDSFQTMVIVAGLLAVLIQGSILTGGFSKAWSIADQRGRIKFDDFSFDPATRHSFWSVVVGGGVLWASMYGINQAQVQRCLSCPTVRKAQIALWVHYPLVALMMLLTFLVGVVMFAFYADCHPGQIITNRDQMLPLFVMDTLADYKGVPGLFVACVFVGSLSSLSSGLSAIAAVTVTDFLEPYLPRWTDFADTVITKLSVVVYGSISIGLACLVGRLGRVLEASLSVYSILNGPLTGVFILGMIFPWANPVGAFIGCITSLVIMAWIGIGSFWHSVSTAPLSPVTFESCPWKNYTASTTPSGAPSDSEHIPAYSIYTLSYLYYTVTGIMVVIVVGLIASFISGHTKPSSVQPVLILPLFDTLFPCLPEKVLRPLRFGVDHTNKYHKYELQTKDIQMDVVDSPTKPAYRFHPATADESEDTSDVSDQSSTKLSPSHIIYENRELDDIDEHGYDPSDVGSGSLEDESDL